MGASFSLLYNIPYLKELDGAGFRDASDAA